MPVRICLCPNPTGPSDVHGMTQLLPSCPQPTLIATILPLHRVSHCPVGAVVSAKHLGELKQASMLKSGSISKQRKGSIFPIWFAPLRHSESQPVMLETELHPDQCTSVSARHCHCWEVHGSSTCPTAAGMVAWEAASTELATELEEVCWDCILFSCCCFSPIVPLFCCSSGSSSSSNPATSQYHSSTLPPSGGLLLQPRCFRKPQPHQEGYLRVDTAPVPGEHLRCLKPGLVCVLQRCMLGQIDPPHMEVGSWSGFGPWLQHFSSPPCPGSLHSRY